MIAASVIEATRYHDISCGHRVAGHENKCAYLHGHNYRIYFTCAARELDAVGRVLDFSVMKEKLCIWLEDNWDHRSLFWTQDNVMRNIKALILGHTDQEEWKVFGNSVVWVPFNPTAENMAEHLLRVVGPEQLKGTGVELTKVVVEETRKCGASARLA